MSLVSAGQLHRLVAENGGFTVSRRTGLSVHRGISLCCAPARSLAFAWDDWDDERVTGWLAERTGETGRRAPYIGGWLDPRSGQVWLDAVRVVWPMFRPAAVLVGRAMQQHCIFDLGRGQTLALRSDAA